ncbi:hypothetical protein AeMF1_009793 [Aphanomyces euteiches]|nr:hypothetical protein AeMF1_009793 [Aphanomyces euteiches]
MTSEWASMLRMARTADGISNGAKWPVLVFQSYQAARDWLVDVTPLEKLKPVLDVEDCVLFYFGRCDRRKTKPEEVLHLAVMPEHDAEMDVYQNAQTKISDPLLALAMKHAREFAEAPSKLGAMELLVQFIIQDSSYALELDEEENSVAHLRKTEQEEDSPELDWSKLFEALWEILVADGWSLASFGQEILYVLPDVDYFNFEVDSTVFKSKRKTLLKAIEFYAETENATASAIWENMWTMMEELKQGKTIVMKNTMFYVTPIIEKFELLKRGENLFATKKDAVVQFSRRMQIPTPQKPKAVPAIAPQLIHVPHSAQNEITIFEEEPKTKSRPKVVKRKQPLQLTDRTHAHPVGLRRRLKSQYPWGLILDVLTKDFGWSYKPGRFGFEFSDAVGTKFESEENAMEFVASTDLLGKVESILKERGAPTPEQEKENGSKANRYAQESDEDDATMLIGNTKEKSKASRTIVKDSGMDADDLPIKKKKVLKPKKRLSYSSPGKSKTQSSQIKFGQIERVLKVQGWKWVSGPMGFIYCKPHVVIAQKGRRFSGKENEDYFMSKENFEVYVRSNQELMKLIRNAISGEHEDVFEMPSDEEVVIKQKKSKVKKVIKESVVEENSEEENEDSSANSGNENESIRNTNTGRIIKKKTKGEIDAISCRPVPTLEVKFANVYKVLQARGWKHRPGMFGYDYFRPGVPKEVKKVINETYYHNEADVEMHLKKTGEWQEIVRSLQRRHTAAFNGFSSPSSSEASPNPKSKSQPPSPATSPFSKTWSQLKANGWTAKMGNSNGENQLYCSPSGDIFTKQELETCEVEKLLLLNPDSPIVEVHDSSDDDEPNQHHDEYMADPVSDKEETKDEEDDSHTIAVQETPDVHVSQNSTAPPSFLSPDETTLSKTDKVVARNVQQDFTPSPSENSSKPTQKSPPQSPAKKTQMDLEIERVLQSLAPSYPLTSLLHRNKEWLELTQFVDACIHRDQRKSVFLSGTPGTGKSALVRLMEQYVENSWAKASKSSKMQFVNLNAMTLGDAASIFKAIASQVTNTDYSSSEQAISALDVAFKSNDSVTFLILDEIDILLRGKGESNLYRLFEWAHHPESSMVFIGIANSIDMTERYLPLLRQRDCKPLSVVFQPYNYDAILDILKQRICEDPLLDKPIFDFMSIAFLARKVASTSGDIRTALNLCRCCLLQKQIQSVASPVLLNDMVNAVKKGLEAPGISLLQTLPRMAQLVVYAASKVHGVRDGVYNINTVYDKYCDLVRKSMSLSQLVTLGEFNQKLDTLEAQGIVTLHAKKGVFKLFVSSAESEKYFASESFFKEL